MSIGLGLALGLPFVIYINHVIRRSVQELNRDIRSRGLDPERVKLMVVARIQAEEQHGFHPQQWLRRKSLMWCYRHQL